MRPIVLLAALAFTAAAGAADKPCTKADAANAAKSIDRVMTWPQLQKAWQDYRQCDSGEVGDTYTDALLRLAVDWKDVKLFADAMKDPGFKEFVFTHLASPAAKDDRPAVYSRAKASCPGGLDTFCAEIAEATKPVK
jgi:hypothetical protein